MAKASDKKPEPAFQPGAYDPTSGEFKYESQSIWWWDNGIWGAAGYAILNDGGKTVSGNETILSFVDFVGAELFNLMHRPDIKFSRPFNANWLYDLHKMLQLGVKRLSDAVVGWTDDRKGDAEHATNTSQAFTVYPVPFFGQRVRQKDARKWCGQILILMSEMVQHSDNEWDDDITNMLVAKAQKALLRIHGDMAMKYLGYTRDEVEHGPLDIPEEKFTAYNPEQLFTSREMTEERQPDRWWPSTNDLTSINGISLQAANIYRAVWPEANDTADGGADEAAWPQGGLGKIVPEPGALSRT